MNNQIHRYLRYLRSKVGKHPRNCLVFALISAEMYFRGPLDRAFEYCLWVVLWALGSKRLSALTVGVAQVSLRNWQQLGFLDSHAPSIHNFWTVVVIKNNYFACARICAIYELRESSPVTEIAAAYTGAARTYYCSKLREGLLGCGQMAAKAGDAASSNDSPS